MIGSNSIRRIVLVGFMGAGKSTVGPLLAQRLGWRFADSDTFIEQQQQTSIAKLFSRHRESGFRSIEAEVIQTLCREEHLVLALGGGAVETAATRELLYEDSATCVVFLEAPIEVMLSRCEQQLDAAVRPVLADRGRLLERLAKRLPHYRCAHLTISTADVSAEEAAARILESLNELPAASCIHLRSKENATA